MNTEEILKAIDEQIAQLQQVRALLVGSTTPIAVAPQRGRPKGSKNKAAAAPAPAPPKVVKRVMSAEGKARIAAAQKLRWEQQRKAGTPVKSAKKKSPNSPTSKAAAKKTIAVEA